MSSVARSDPTPPLPPLPPPAAVDDADDDDDVVVVVVLLRFGCRSVWSKGGTREWGEWGVGRGSECRWCGE